MGPEHIDITPEVDKSFPEDQIPDLMKECAAVRTFDSIDELMVYVSSSFHPFHPLKIIIIYTFLFHYYTLPNPITFFLFFKSFKLFDENNRANLGKKKG